MVLLFITFFLLVVDLAVAVSNVTYTNTVYIITNAETPSLNLPGLTPVGKQRAEQCLPAFFRHLNIGFITTCPLNKKTGLCAETITTANPIASSLGLTVNTQCGDGGTTSDDCLTDLLSSFAKNSTQNMLVVWDINGMDDLFDALSIDEGDLPGEEDPDDATPHYDVLWTVVKGDVKTITSQGCAGLDGRAPGT
ncbi:hypothetical protein CPC08DRAFT_33150 [Agrocybe pediades]|nr:hypothetical protein CPC08DRAFT_33150 [Agrocybe pediades]